jgi:hypothetical protein
VSASGAGVFVNSSGKLGTLVSSRRYKEEIADVAGESDVLMKLRPVAFYYRPEYDETHTRQYGLVAEEVAEVAPQLVTYDDAGGAADRPLSLRECHASQRGPEPAAAAPGAGLSDRGPRGPSREAGGPDERGAMKHPRGRL